MADLAICIDGHFIAIEVKMPGEEPSQLQLADGKEVMASGGVWFTAETVEEALEGIADALDRKIITRTASRR